MKSEEKKLYESIEFFRELTFFDKIWAKEWFAFRKWTFVIRDMGMGVVFFVKKRKKRASEGLFGPIP